MEQENKNSPIQNICRPKAGEDLEEEIVGIRPGKCWQCETPCEREERERRDKELKKSDTERKEIIGEGLLY